jgi:hypothetical protein
MASFARYLRLPTPFAVRFLGGIMKGFGIVKY